jgi:predicted histone-like DNA-binding protein
MSILFNKIERGNPQNPTAPKKWFTSLKTLNRVSEKEVAKLVSDETTINRKEVEMALDQFQKILVRLLLDSHSVELGDWGTFRLTCSGEGADTAEALTAANIKSLRIRFTAGKELRKALSDATFIAAETVLTKQK